MKKKFKLFGKTYEKTEVLTAAGFMLPAVVLGIIFVMLPIVLSLMFAFTDANMLRLDKINYVGLKNFIQLFSKDELALTSLKNSLFFTVCVVPLHFSISLGLACLLNKQRFMKTFFRWIFFIPNMLSLAVLSLLWSNLFGQTGVINSFIVAMGGTAQGFLEDPNQAMICIIFISAWAGAGYQMILFLGAMQAIPKDYYEAAEIDGCIGTKAFWYITLPQLIPTLGFVIITMLIGAFRLIVQPMIMTGGGPLDSTLTVSYYIYRQGITFREVGYSSAIALVYTFIISFVALNLRRVFRKLEENLW
jgi:transmembrane permease msmF